MIVYRVTRDDGGGGYVNFPCGFCAKCYKIIGTYHIPDYKFCPWCGHKFRRKRQNITYDELMKIVNRT